MLHRIMVLCIVCCVRMHHLAALKQGHTDCNERTNDISGMIVSAQRVS